MNVDTTEKPFTAVEWCAGYAGIHLGLKRVIPNLRVVAFSEIESFACENLVAKMEAGLLDAAPIWTNLKTFPCEAFSGKVDLLVAGYPCQPFSHAGKRAGEEDERHLWPYIADGIRTMRPRFCFFENVEGHITLGLSTVISDLAEMGYKATWGVFSASEVGAPHQRKRVFILAYDSTAGFPVSYRPRTLAKRQRFPESECRSQLAHDIGTGLQGHERIGLYSQQIGERREGPHGATAECCDGRTAQVWPSRPGEPQYEWEPPRVTGQVDNPMFRRYRSSTEQICTGGDSTLYTSTGETQSAMGGDTHGTADRVDYAELYTSCDNRVDELRLLGNGVVPATAARAWEVLYSKVML